MSSIVDVSEVLLELGFSGSVTEEQRAVVNMAIRKAEADVVLYLRYDPRRASRTEYYPQQNYQAQSDRGIWEVTETQAVLRQVSEAATSELQLQHLPVRSVTTVHVDYDGRSGTRVGSFATETLKAEGVDFWANYDSQDGDGNKVCRDGILRALGLWPTTAGTVRVVYVAGYDEDELRGSDPVLNASPLWAACLDEACRRARRVLTTKKTSLGLPAGLFSSESLGSYSYSLDTASAAAQLFAGQITGENKERLESYVNYGWSLG